ncbi:DNA-directed RNA polymerase subunit omega [Wolbachia endosymbiont of Pentidionis agamae]|uniref:DNA-directed RNA polymerase subunit omega n=1 Tax=Wolbachia endosymbiont of Pentidionis agamae TaxID=3110435 RepID=UPI002FCE7CC3
MSSAIIESYTEHINRFKLVLLASQRAYELSIEMNQASSMSNNHKSTTISLHEITEGKVDLHKLFDSLVLKFKKHVSNVANAYSSDSFAAQSQEGGSKYSFSNLSGSDSNKSDS